MNKNVLIKLYWILWCSTTILTGILSGFMISHSINYGRFLHWLVESGKEGLLHQTLTIYRETSSASFFMGVYYSFIWVALLSGIIWVVTAFLLKRERIIAIIAGLSSLWVGIIFSFSGIDAAEEAVHSGIANADMTQLYLSLYMPVHTCFAIIYTASFILLLYVALKEKMRID